MGVTEVNGVLRRGALDGAEADGVAHRALCPERPIDAAGLGVERIYVADIGSNEDAARSHCRLAERREAGRETEGPFQLEFWHVGCGEASVLSVLKASIGFIDAPPVP